MTQLDLILQGLVILLFGTCGVGVCRFIAGKTNDLRFPTLLQRARHLYLALPLLLALPFVDAYISSRPALFWDMPGWLQIHWAAISCGLVSAIIAYVFGFCLAVAFLSGQKQKWALFVFGAAMLVVVQVHSAWIFRPNLPPLTAISISDDGVILQTSPYTCVPASAANIAALLGVQATEKELADLFRTTKDGTFPAAALQGLEKLGITGRKATSTDSNIHSIKAPAMIFVLADTHAMVFAGMTNGLAEIWNPSFGKAYVPEWRLRHIWDGHALEFQRAIN